MRFLAALTTLMLATFIACGGDGGAMIDAAGSGSGSGSSAVCTGLIYDACNPAASNCMNGMTCKLFNGSSFSVCTPTCTPNTACAMQGSTAITCNNMGFCKPPAPNADCKSP